MLVSEICDLQFWFSIWLQGNLRAVSQHTCCIFCFSQPKFSQMSDSLNLSSWLQSIKALCFQHGLRSIMWKFFPSFCQGVVLYSLILLFSFCLKGRASKWMPCQFSLPITSYYVSSTQTQMQKATRVLCREIGALVRRNADFRLLYAELQNFKDPFCSLTKSDCSECFLCKI